MALIAPCQGAARDEAEEVTTNRRQFAVLSALAIDPARRA
jgi:hypothetical protein